MLRSLLIRLVIVALSVCLTFVLSVHYCTAQIWQTVSGEFNGYYAVYSLYGDTVENGLYVGGDFDSIGSNIGTRSIALWKDNQWTALASGLNNYQFPASLRDITMYNGDLYVGGYLTNAGAVSCQGIAKWNGSVW